MIKWVFEFYESNYDSEILKFEEFNRAKLGRVIQNLNEKTFTLAIKTIIIIIEKVSKW